MSNRKQAFDALKALFPGIWNRPGTIKEMNELLSAAGIPDSMVTPDAPSLPETPGAPRSTSPVGLALIKEFESCAKAIGAGRFMAYPDPGTGGKPWTIGWGSTTDFDGKPIQPGTVWTQAQCDDRKAHDMKRFERDVIAALGSAIEATSQPQFDALVSFAYNCGAAKLRSSTLLRMHKAGDYAGAAKQFARWNTAAGRVLPGLTRRRAAEAELYRKGSK